VAPPARAPSSLPLLDPLERGAQHEPVKRAGGRRSKVRTDLENMFAEQISQYRMPVPVRQFPFARALQRQFKSDFAWPDYRLLVEIEGGIWKPGGGAHSHPIDIERDCERRQYAIILRWHMLPITGKQVRNSHGIALLMVVLERLGWTPPP